MEGVLLIVAWLAGVASLLMVADMIVADISMRRAERIAARRDGRGVLHRRSALEGRERSKEGFSR
jgi:hypothetical protein